jgi:hypothetical protein
MDFQESLHTVVPDIPSGLPGVVSADGLLLVPAAATGISVIIMLLHGVISVTRVLERLGIVAQTPKKLPPPGIGKGAILRFRAARLLGCLCLLALSVTSVGHTDGDNRRQAIIKGGCRVVPYVRRAFSRFDVV